MEAVVKWFNLTKGFGFVAPADGSQDAFMHASALAALGMKQVAEGTKLLVEIGVGPKGRQVLRIVQVLGMAPETETWQQRSPSTGPTETVVGTVKWYKIDKGFGFVTPDDGGKDVFVHRSVVARAGISQLDPGQRVSMSVQSTMKGREAVSLEQA